MIVDGFVQIFVSGDSGTIVLAKLGPGAFFGEQALLTDRARSASARAHTDVTLLKLGKEQFSTLLQGHRETLEAKGRQEVRFRDLLRTGGLRTLFTDGEEVPDERVFPDGAVVFREGDDPDGTYLVLSGAADVLKNHGDTVLQVSRLGPGNVFGEKAVLEGTKRAATIRASGELRVWFASTARVLDACRRNPALGQYFASLCRIYRLPQRGLVTQYTDVTAGGDHVVVTTYELSGGARVLARHEDDRFVAERVDPGVGSPERWKRVAGDVPTREVWLTADGVIAKLSTEATWDGLAGVFERLLRLDRVSDADGRALLAAAERLSAPGTDPADDAVVCRCMRVTGASIRQAMQAGARSLDALQDRLGCGTVCGGCKPDLLAMTGVAAWAGVRIEVEARVGDDVGIFSLRPIGNRAMRTNQSGRFDPLQWIISTFPSTTKTRHPGTSPA